MGCSSKSRARKHSPWILIDYDANTGTGGRPGVGPCTALGGGEPRTLHAIVIQRLSWRRAYPNSHAGITQSHGPHHLYPQVHDMPHYGTMMCNTVPWHACGTTMCNTVPWHASLWYHDVQYGTMTCLTMVEWCAMRYHDMPHYGTMMCNTVLWHACGTMTWMRHEVWRGVLASDLPGATEGSLYVTSATYGWTVSSVEYSMEYSVDTCSISTSYRCYSNIKSVPAYVCLTGPRLGGLQHLQHFTRKLSRKAWVTHTLEWIL